MINPIGSAGKSEYGLKFDKLQTDVFCPDRDCTISLSFHGRGINISSPLSLNSESPPGHLVVQIVSILDLV